MNPVVCVVLCNKVKNILEDESTNVVDFFSALDAKEHALKIINEIVSRDKKSYNFWVCISGKPQAVQVTVSYQAQMEETVEDRNQIPTLKM